MALAKASATPDRRQDHLRLSEPHGRRGGRRRRRHLQRIFADPGADFAREARHLLWASAPPAVSAGALARRSAPSSRRRTNSWSRRLGDGAYMFANPMVAHWVSDVHKLPILTIVFNNSLYGAVRGATMSMFKDGVAGEDGGRFMADLRRARRSRPRSRRRAATASASRRRPSCRSARPRHRRRDEGEAPGAAQRDLPAVTRRAAAAQ